MRGIVLCWMLGMILLDGAFAFGQQGVLKKGYYPDGKVRYEGYFEGDEPVGKMTRYYPDGRIQAELFHQGDKTEAVLYSKHGEYVSAGCYQNRLKEGEWHYKKGERVIATETYKENKLDGVSRKYFTSGKIAEERDWKQGFPEGIWKAYYPDGGLRIEAGYVDGKLEGKMQGYYPDGSVMAKGMYRNNLKEGVWYYYGRDGELKKTKTFRGGIAEDQQEEDIEESRKLDKWIDEGKKIVDPVHFIDDPEMYLKAVGD